MIQLIELPHGLDGHNRHFFAEPIAVDVLTGQVKLRCADPGRRNQTVWQDRPTYEIALGNATNLIQDQLVFVVTGPSGRPRLFSCAASALRWATGLIYLKPQMCRLYQAQLERGLSVTWQYAFSQVTIEITIQS